MPVKRMLTIAVHIWHLSPRDFWSLTPTEWWALNDGSGDLNDAREERREMLKTDNHGLTQKDREELLDENAAQGIH